MKNTSHDSYKPVAEQHYKKKYLERKIQEQEADEEIQTYERTTEEYPTEDSIHNRPT
jgi:hypothetical protein